MEEGVGREPRHRDVAELWSQVDQSHCHLEGGREGGREGERYRGKRRSVDKGRVGGKECRKRRGGGGGGDRKEEGMQAGREVVIGAKTLRVGNRKKEWKVEGGSLTRTIILLCSM